MLIRLATDAEPAFLAQILRSSYARGVLRLIGSTHITPEGPAFVIANSLLPLIVDILVDSSLVIP